MKPDLSVLSNAQRFIVDRLRSPLVARAFVQHGYSTNPENFGYVLRTSPGQDVVTVGDGVVEKVAKVAAKWSYSPGSYHATSTSFCVVINHGQGIRSVVHGLLNVQLSGSASVTRGQRLGYAVDSEIFIGVQISGNYYDPAALNRHFVAVDGDLLPGSGGTIEGAPNLLAQAAGSVVSVLRNGIRYFLNPEPALWNVAFNGNGTKLGYAAIGLSESDVWNVYQPIAFEEITQYYYACGEPSRTFSAEPLFYLDSHAGNVTPVALERISPLQAVGGSGMSWDELLKAWVGGWNSSTPYFNTFRIRNLPAGNYQLFLYANQGTLSEASVFYASIDGSTPVQKTNAPSGTAGFVENVNYVRYAITVAGGQNILIRVYGYLSGLQLFRG